VITSAFTKNIICQSPLAPRFRYESQVLVSLLMGLWNKLHSGAEGIQKNKKPSPGGEGSYQGASTSSVILSYGGHLRKN
jgi:hypothetical protein